MYLCAAVVFLGAAALTLWVRRLAIDQGVIDYPNARSSHSIATPRGGGLAIVIATAFFVVWRMIFESVEFGLAISILVGGLLIAIVGFFDDRVSLPVRVRLSLHIVAAAWAVWVLGGLPEFQIGSAKLDLGFAGDMLGVFAIVWALNLFNFMDGIDGIAGSEAVFILIGGVISSLGSAALGGVSAVAIAVASACLGFLLWNWPPAKIFMGDVGSGYLGYVIAVLALASAHENPVAIFAWLILGGVFFVDATVTLVRRLIRGERVYEAHRSHAYQIMARRWGSHRRVTLAVCAINVGWLLPIAWLSLRFPHIAVWCTAVALTPLCVLAIYVGAGRAEP